MTPLGGPPQEGSRVLVVRVSPSLLQDQLDQALTGLGYMVESVPASKLAERLPDPRTGTAIILLSVPGIPDDLVQAVVSGLQGLPKLGIVLDGADVWRSPLLESCHDILSWPCPEGELAYRLGRIEAFSAPAAAVDEAEVLAVFESIGVMGHSRAFVEVLRSVKRVAPSDASVLIEGCTGTGKELVARALHKLSPRRDAPFIPVNCGAIPDALFENELFGHERGAFTDARSAQSGIVEQANRGTLFLDEIESLPPRGQVVLLRFLQDREYRSLGGGPTRRADVRVIAATNVSLRGLVDEGSFREDLYFRLNLVHVVLPRLRNRPEDIHLLARHFAERYSPDYDVPVRPFHPATKSAMMRYPWPGNVRELENFVHRSILMSDPEQRLLTGEPWSRPGGSPAKWRSRKRRAPPPFKEAKQQVIESFERDYLVDLLRRTQGNLSEAARRAGKERRALGKLLKRHGIRRVDYVEG